MTMKSQRQAKFEAAVLRRLFFNNSSSSSSSPLPPPPPPPPPIASPSLVSRSIQGLQSHDLESQDEEENDGGSANCSDKTSGDEEAEVAKTSLTRAQRKRLKIKRLKEAKRKPSAPPGRFIGPLRPGEGSVVITDGNSSASTEVAITSFHNCPDQSVERNTAVEADCERPPSSHDCILLSKSKRRKLAKKKNDSPKDQSRNSRVSIFTADIGEHGYIIRKGSLIG